MILITTFLWSGARAWRPGVFAPKHVAGLAKMLRDNLTVPHRFVCICDAPYWDPLRAMGIDVWPLWSWPKATVKAWGGADSWVRLGLLGAPGKRLGKEVDVAHFLNFDIDTIVRGNVDDIVQQAADETLIVYWSKRDRGEAMKTGQRRGFQGCLWGGKLGGFPECWKACDSDKVCEEATRSWIGSDQALLTHLCSQSDYDTNPLEDVPRWDEDSGMVLDRNVEDVPDWRVLFCFGGDDSKPWNHPSYGRLYSKLTGLPLDPERFPLDDGRICQLHRLRRFRE